MLDPVLAAPHIAAIRDFYLAARDAGDGTAAGYLHKALGWLALATCHENLDTEEPAPRARKPRNRAAPTHQT